MKHESDPNIINSAPIDRLLADIYEAFVIFNDIRSGAIVEYRDASGLHDAGEGTVVLLNSDNVTEHEGRFRKYYAEKYPFLVESSETPKF